MYINIIQMLQQDRELKVVDLEAGSYAFQGGGSITPINLITTGTSVCNRVGRKIHMVAVQINGAMIPLRTCATEYLRILIVYDKQPYPNTPTISDILQDISQLKVTNTDVYSHPNVNNRERFVILRDHRIAMPSFTLTGAQVSNLGFVDSVAKTFIFDDYVVLGNLPTIYKADNSPCIQGDIATGGLYIVTWGNLAAGSEGIRLDASIRLTFFDA